MKAKTLLFMTVFVAFASCHNAEVYVPYEEKVLGIDQLTGVRHDIMVNILSSRFDGYRKGQPATRAMSAVSLTPYIDNGDTLLYIAQYADGWEVYSAREEANLLIFSSDRGQFDMADPNMPKSVRDLILANAEAIRNIPKDANIPVHESWGAPAMTEDDFAKGKITIRRSDTRATSDEDLPPGTWVLIEKEVLSTDVTTSPKLTVTKWGQQNPWNKYTKLITVNNQPTWAPVGCTPVAVGQYLYYTHFLNGIPKTTISSAVPNGSTDYTFVGESNDIWNQMAVAYGYGYSGYDQTAVFLGYLGRMLKADYVKNPTSVAINDKLNYLSGVYGVPFVEQDINFWYIKNSINQKYPVLAGAQTNKTTSGESQSLAGHAFIIDRYRVTTETVRYLYGLDRDSWSGDGDDPYDNNDVDDQGNIIGWAYTNEIIKEFTSEEISMNWGYSGQWDYIFYHPYYSWDAGGHNFNLRHKIITRSDIQ